MRPTPSGSATRFSGDELAEFVELARSVVFFQPKRVSTVAELPALTQTALAGSQSLLHWRKSLFDPDRLFTWLAPTFWFFWTRAFLVLSAACILLPWCWSGPTGRSWPAVSPTPCAGRRPSSPGLTLLRGHAAARVRPRADVQALRRRGPRDRLPADVLHAVLLLQRLRRLAVPRKVEAAVGDVRRRLLRAVPLGAGGLRLAADAARTPCSTTWPSWCCRSAASRRCSTSTRC